VLLLYDGFVRNNTERSSIENIPRGRPRSRTHDVAILEATLRLMERDGYTRTSMEAVAAEAGTTKASIYRRYPGKAELATAALAYLRERRPAPASGDPRSDLVEELRRFRAGVERPHGLAMVGTVLAEERHVPELIDAFRRDVVRPRRERLRAILERAELREGLDLDIAVNMAVGSYYAAYLAGGSPGPGWEEGVADALLVSAAAPGAGRRAGSRRAPAGGRPHATPSRGAVE
jgi:AcrR family transcriptional regulator